MNTETIRVTADDGHELDAYVARPERRPKGGIVVIQEIFGVNGHICDVTEGFAADGYLAIAPALFDRRQSGVELGYEGDDVDAGRALVGEISWDEVARDVTAAAAAVAEAGKVGVVGYCWGGAVAWLAACRCPVAAAVGYYGRLIIDLKDERPRCPILLHYGETDATIPLEQVEEIRALHPEVPVHLYPAGHGFNCDRRASYDAESAVLARERTLAFFAEHLG